MKNKNTIYLWSLLVTILFVACHKDCEELPVIEEVEEIPECQELSLSVKGLAGQITQINGNPVVFANISLTSYNQQNGVENSYITMSNEYGNFSFENINSGEYYLNYNTYYTECETNTLVLLPGYGPINIEECGDEVNFNINNVEFVPVQIIGLDTLSLGVPVIQKVFLNFNLADGEDAKPIWVRNPYDCIREEITSSVKSQSPYFEINSEIESLIFPGSAVQRWVLLDSNNTPSAGSTVVDNLIIETTTPTGTEIMTIEVRINN